MTSSTTTDPQRATVDGRPAADGVSVEAAAASADERSRRSTAGARARLAYVPALDGFRGLGLFFVMAAHADFSWARGGFLWVSTFFTLSGYLITSLLIVEWKRHGSVSATAFWSRRFRRLMPAAIVTLALVVVFGAVLADATQLNRLRADGISALFYVANWRFVFSNTAYADLFASPSPVQHFWTLSIEEQFYLLFPIVLLGALWLGRGRWKVVAGVVGAMTVASIIWMLWLSSQGANVDRLYFGTDTRLPELTMGVLLGILLGFWKPPGNRWAGRLIEIAGLLALVTMLVMTFTVNRTDAWLYRGGLALYAVLSCVMVMGAIQHRSMSSRLLSFKPLVAFGLLSYTAYLVHWPTYLVLSEERTGLGQSPLFVVRFVATVAVAYGIYRFVEGPIRSGKRLKGRVALVAVPLSFLLVTAGFVAVTRNPPALAVNLAGDDQVDPPPVAPGAVKVMIVGDSQAWVLGNALRRWSEANPTQAAVWNAAGRGCGIMRGGTTIRLGQVTEGVCEDWDVQWKRKLERFNPDVVMVMSSGWDWVPRKLPEWDDYKKYGDPAFNQKMVDDYTEAAAVLSSRGAQVVWMTNACYELEAFSTDDPRIGNEKIIPQVVASKPDSVRVYDFFADLCPAGQFTKNVGGDPNGRPDGIHLSDRAADYEASIVMPKMVAVKATKPGS